MADKRTETYANDAEASRERLNTTIDDIQGRLSPRAIAGEAVEAVQERGAALVRSAGEHKLALGLIGGAVGLLFLARKATSGERTPARGRAARGRDDDGDADSGVLRRSWESVREAGSTVGETAAEKWGQARERTAEITSKARFQAGEASRLAAENFDSNPLVGAVVGMTAGAVLAALLPRTDAENGLIGDQRDRFADAAREAIKAAVDAGRGALETHGLSTDVAKIKIDGLKDQAADIARSVGQAAADSFRASRGGNA